MLMFKLFSHTSQKHKEGVLTERQQRLNLLGQNSEHGSEQEICYQ